jgi:predicted nucleic acid-binding protein
LTFLLDTNVVSELRKLRLGKADPRFQRWAALGVIGQSYISAITVYELEIGFLQIERRDPRQAATLRTWLQFAVLPVFEKRVLALDADVAKCAAKLHVPNPRPLNDSYIAATALVHGMTVATRNVADFVPMGVTLLNPWDP